MFVQYIRNSVLNSVIKRLAALVDAPMPCIPKVHMQYFSRVLFDFFRIHPKAMDNFNYSYKFFRVFQKSGFHYLIWPILV